MQAQRSEFKFFPEGSLWKWDPGFPNGPGAVWMPCDWSPCGLDEEIERADGKGSREFSEAQESCHTMEVGKADGQSHGPSCLM